MSNKKPSNKFEHTNEELRWSCCGISSTVSRACLEPLQVLKNQIRFVVSRVRQPFRFLEFTSVSVPITEVLRFTLIGCLCLTSLQNGFSWEFAIWQCRFTVRANNVSQISTIVGASAWNTVGYSSRYRSSFRLLHVQRAFNYRHFTFSTISHWYVVIVGEWLCQIRRVKNKTNFTYQAVR